MLGLSILELFRQWYVLFFVYQLMVQKWTNHSLKKCSLSANQRFVQRQHQRSDFSPRFNKNRAKLSIDKRYLTVFLMTSRN
jgi:hypothetical protein